MPTLTLGAAGFKDEGMVRLLALEMDQGEESGSSSGFPGAHYLQAPVVNFSLCGFSSPDPGTATLA